MPGLSGGLQPRYWTERMILSNLQSRKRRLRLSSSRCTPVLQDSFKDQNGSLLWSPHGTLSMKDAARDNPAEPSNFRPIALTSYVGKVFTSILSNSWLHYMVANQYLDTNTQKAFVRNIPGCTE